MKGRIAHLTIPIERKNGKGNIPSLVVAHFADLVSKGILHPGDKLPSELEMTRKFEISRISLREAIKLLEAKGYVESRGRRGKFIRAITDNAIAEPMNAIIASGQLDISQIFEIKKIFDGESAFIAATRASDEDTALLRVILSDVENIISSGKNNALELAQVRYHDFFTTLSRITGNILYNHMTCSFQTLLKKVMNGNATVLSAREQWTHVTDHLALITSAVERKAPTEARNAVHTHTEFLCARFA
jgi:GntR family transcriptional repressor for pyruvate dehydrogenase complex